MFTFGESFHPPQEPISEAARGRSRSDAPAHAGGGARLVGTASPATAAPAPVTSR